MNIEAHRRFTFNAIERQNLSILKKAFSIFNSQVPIVQTLSLNDDMHDTKLEEWYKLWVSYINCIVDLRSNRMYRSCVHLTKTVDQLCVLIRRCGLQQGFWFYPLLGNLCRDLRLLTYVADKTPEYCMYDSNGRRLLLCEALALDCISKCFRLSANFDRQLYSSSKPLLVALANQQMKLYNHLHNYTLGKSLIKTVEDRPLAKSNALISDQITYSYFQSIQILNSSTNNQQMAHAMQLLEFAYRKIPKKTSLKNRRLILLRLVPLKMLLAGQLPSVELFKRENIDEYEGLCKALRTGNIMLYDKLIQQHQSLLLRYGTMTLFDELRLLAYRQFLYKIESILKESKYNIHIFVDLKCHLSNIQCPTRGEEDSINSEEDIEFMSITLELIRRGLMKAKPASSKKLRLLLKKTNPFPSPSSLTEQCQ